MQAIEDFPLFLLIGMVSWNFFSAATNISVTSIMRYSNFVKNIPFPKICIVIASVLSIVFSHIIEIAVVVAICFIVKGPSFYALLLIPLLMLNILLAVGFAIILSIIGVYFLDMQRIWGLLTSLGFFLTPIFYSLEMLSPQRQMIIKLNPMTHTIQAARDALIGFSFPQSYGGLVYVFTLALFLIVFGYLLFKKFEGHFVEKIQ